MRKLWEVKMFSGYGTPDKLWVLAATMQLAVMKAQNKWKKQGIKISDSTLTGAQLLGTVDLV